jgi:hypothetical protein
MDEKTERRMHRLLARGRLSRPELDVIRESVLDAVRREKNAKRPARVYTLWATGAALAAAAAVLLLVFVPREPVGHGGHVEIESGELGSGITLEVRCSVGTLSACPASASLVFSVRAKSGRAAGFVSAYAEPVSGGERVFYLSKEDGSAELAAKAEDARGSEHAVRIGSAQQAGRYRVHAFFAKRPLTRAEMVAEGPISGVAAWASVEVVLVE